MCIFCVCTGTNLACFLSHFMNKVNLKSYNFLANIALRRMANVVIYIYIFFPYTSRQSNINFYVADETTAVKTEVKTLDDIGPEFNFSVKVQAGGSAAKQIKHVLITHIYVCLYIHRIYIYIYILTQSHVHTDLNR